MEKYSIKVDILNRPYPLLVRQEEEAVVRKASDLINNKIRQYKERFNVKDDLDLVIMCCLELATDNLNQATANKQSRVEAGKVLDLVNDLLNNAILTTEEVSTSE